MSTSPSRGFERLSWLLRIGFASGDLTWLRSLKVMPLPIDL